MHVTVDNKWFQTAALSVLAAPPPSPPFFSHGSGWREHRWSHAAEMESSVENTSHAAAETRYSLLRLEAVRVT